MSFESLIIELGEALDTPLHLDEKNCCTILINEVFTVQIEVDEHEEFLMIGGAIVPLAPGTYRIATLKEALRNQGLERGILSFIPSTSALFIHRKVPLESLSGETLMEIIIQLSEKGMQWKNAIENGKIAPEAIT